MSSLRQQRLLNAQARALVGAPNAEEYWFKARVTSPTLWLNTVGRVGFCRGVSDIFVEYDGVNRLVSCDQG